MKQLSRNEIIKLRAKAIAKAFHGNEVYEGETDEQYSERDWRSWEKEAQAIIEADEKAGVLVLREDGLEVAIIKDGKILTRIPVYHCKEGAVE